MPSAASPSRKSPHAADVASHKIDPDLRAVTVPEILVEEAVDEPPRAGKLGGGGLTETHAVKAANQRIDDPFGQRTLERMPLVVGRHEIERMLGDRPGQPLDPLWRDGADTGVQNDAGLRRKAAGSREDGVQRSCLPGDTVVWQFQNVDGRTRDGELEEIAAALSVSRARAAVPFSDPLSTRTIRLRTPPKRPARPSRTAANTPAIVSASS